LAHFNHRWIESADFCDICAHCFRDLQANCVKVRISNPQPSAFILPPDRTYDAIDFSSLDFIPRECVYRARVVRIPCQHLLLQMPPLFHASELQVSHCATVPSSLIDAWLSVQFWQRLSSSYRKVVIELPFAADLRKPALEKWMEMLRSNVDALSFLSLAYFHESSCFTFHPPLQPSKLFSVSSAHLHLVANAAWVDMATPLQDKSSPNIPVAAADCVSAVLQWTSACQQANDAQSRERVTFSRVARMETPPLFGVDISSLVSLRLDLMDFLRSAFDVVSEASDDAPSYSLCIRDLPSLRYLTLCPRIS
jgi:aryl carrier-like protein